METSTRLTSGFSSDSVPISQIRLFIHTTFLRKLLIISRWHISIRLPIHYCPSRFNITCASMLTTLLEIIVLKFKMLNSFLEHSILFLHLNHLFSHIINWRWLSKLTLSDYFSPVIITNIIVISGQHSHPISQLKVLSLQLTHLILKLLLILSQLVDSVSQLSITCQQVSDHAHTFNQSLTNSVRI